MPFTTAVDDSLEYFFVVVFLEKVRLDISLESSARQRIHMKHQALFSSNDKSEKKIKKSSAAVLLSSLRVNSLPKHTL